MSVLLHFIPPNRNLEPYSDQVLPMSLLLSSTHFTGAACHVQASSTTSTALALSTVPSQAIPWTKTAMEPLWRV